MAGPVEAVRRLLGKWLEGRRRGYVLTLVALRRLEERGEEATVERIREEGLRILERTGDRVDWGVTREEYTVGMVSSILRELAESGVVDVVDGGRSASRYRISKDAEEEFLSSFGHLLQLARMPK